ncbi:MAG: hypothetical protein QNJ55_19680 [Xenococcus sp. MO_188.B8]|nr:hypothetical protein [Xenococcus sp. MO_188.B8]
MVKNFALLEIQRESEQKQLYYHSCDHAYAVRQRADIIFQAIEPFGQEVTQVSLKRIKHLIDICAIAHDMVQEFLPHTELHTSRKREPGVSEAATISKLINYIASLNIKSNDQKANRILFTDSDLQIIKEAIEATICLYDFADNSIYQPYLYSTAKKISLPARIIALADIGSLGIEGIEAYFQEGSLIFLEENPDIISIILNEEYKNQPELSENLRQRLLQRARFQVNFARGRKARFASEVTGLPGGAIYVLKHNVFKFLNQDTIKKIESITPTADDTLLEELLEFFDLKKLIKYNSLFTNN